MRPALKWLSGSVPCARDGAAPARESPSTTIRIEARVMRLLAAPARDGRCRPSRGWWNDGRRLVGRAGGRRLPRGNRGAARLGGGELSGGGRLLDGLDTRGVELLAGEE